MSILFFLKLMRRSLCTRSLGDRVVFCTGPETQEMDALVSLSSLSRCPESRVWSLSLFSLESRSENAE